MKKMFLRKMTAIVLGVTLTINLPLSAKAATTQCCDNMDLQVWYEEDPYEKVCTEHENCMLEIVNIIKHTKCRNCHNVEEEVISTTVTHVHVDED